MESTISAKASPLYMFNCNPNRDISPIRPNLSSARLNHFFRRHIASLQPSKPPNSILHQSNSPRNLCKPAAFASGAGGGSPDGGESSSNLSVDTIVLDVRGMSCEGCVASVKRILESQPQVSSASVNLATETAIIWPVSKAKALPDWQKHLGENLAKHLTGCGFKSNLQTQGVTEEGISS